MPSPDWLRGVPSKDQISAGENEPRGVMARYGLGKWKTDRHFVSWLRLCPDNEISADKIIGQGRLLTTNRVATALRMAASSLRMSNTNLGALRFPARSHALHAE
jgi:hypothetical protein